jgi:CMP-N-acetylneuraminic acid synthetase
MTVTEIRKKAKELKVKNYARLAKGELIRAIQQAEGNSDCYEKIGDCGQTDCCWRSDCQV